MFIIPVTIESLLNVTPSVPPETLTGSKNTCATVLYLSLQIHNNTQLHSADLKSELHLLPVSKMGKFHSLVFGFSDCPFSITVTMHFRPNRGHSNERLDYKCYSSRGRIAFYNQPLMNYGNFSLTSFIFWIKRKHEYKILKNLSLRNKFP